MPPADGFPLTPFCLAAALLAAFVLPGYGLASWLHGRQPASWPFRWVLGFAWSFAVFGVVATPFLWFGRSFAEFLAVLYPTWAVFAVLGGGAYLLALRRPPATDEPRETAGESSPADPVPPAGDAAGSRGLGLLLLVAYLAVLAALGFVWGQRDAGNLTLIILGSPILVAAGGVAAWRFRRAFAPLLRFTAEDDGPASWPWAAVAAGVIALQAAGAVALDRPDWDDCFYLAAVLDYQHADALNAEEPTHREGLPMPGIYRMLSWELWGAVVCHLSGLSPLALFHTLLPGPLVLLAYAAYRELFAEWLPRRWVPLALIGLSAVHLWGISSHHSAANYLLPRLWQGKAVLLHLAIPLLIVLLTRFARQPSWRQWLSLPACVVFGVAVSGSAIFLMTILVLCLAPALVAAQASFPPGSGLLVRFRAVARAAVRPASLRFLVGAALALVPLVGCGLAFRAAMGDAAVMQARPLMMENWFTLLLSCTQDGCAEIAWFFALPLLAALLGGVRRGAYLVAFPALLGLTFANPLLFEPVAAHVTSYHTYFRMWWLLPVGPGLAVLLVLVVRFLTRLRGPRAWPGPVAFPLLATAAGLAATWALPGVAVWGPRNNYIGRLGTPHLAENVEKMPADLAPVAAALAREADAADGRILCNEEVASFLTPYARPFRFVQTRAMYTLVGFTEVGRPAEALERYVLARALRSGEFPGRLDPVEETSLRSSCGDEAVRAIWGPFPDGQAPPDLCALLKRYRVRWAVMAPGDRGGGLLQANGYQPVLQEGRFTLWKTEDR